jgi:starch synthase
MFSEQPLDFYFVTIEMAPFSKLTGMADLLHSLVSELARRGHHVNVIMPDFQGVDGDLIFQETVPLISTSGDSIILVPVKCAKDKQGVRYFMVDDHTLRDCLARMSHGDPGTGFPTVWLDFCYASYLILNLQLQQSNPDCETAIVHAFHWQTGPLLPLLARELSSSRPRMVFTVDLLERQGRFNPDVLGCHEIFHFLDRDNEGEVNFLKAAIGAADKLHTVSPSYAEEIQRSPNSSGLEELFAERQRKGELRGILNGIDHKVINWGCIPELREVVRCGCQLPEDIAAIKRNAKEVFQRSVGLPVDPNAFLITMGHRFARQKNFDIVARSIDGLMQLDPAPQIYLRAWPEPTQDSPKWGLWWTLIRKSLRYRHNVAFVSPFDRDRSLTDEGIFIDRFLYYAASDLFLMPSLWEPCGLCQLEAMRFGSLPVVSAVGGLRDTVRPYDKEGNGWGFWLRNPLDENELVDVVKTAIYIKLEQPSTWAKMVSLAIDFDSSIENSVDQYLNLINALR